MASFQPYTTFSLCSPQHKIVLKHYNLTRARHNTTVLSYYHAHANHIVIKHGITVTVTVAFIFFA